MTLESIYYIGQTVAVIVIIATLIALLIQTRQTNALARAETSRSIMLRGTSEQYRLFESPEKAAFMYKAMQTSEKLTEEEQLRFSFAMALMFGNMEIGYNMHRTGLMGDFDFARVMDVAQGAYLISPRVRQWWSNTRLIYAKNPEFVAVVDKLSAAAEADAAANKRGSHPESDKPA